MEGLYDHALHMTTDTASYWGMHQGPHTCKPFGPLRRKVSVRSSFLSSVPHRTTRIRPQNSRVALKCLSLLGLMQKQEHCGIIHVLWWLISVIFQNVFFFIKK